MMTEDISVKMSVQITAAWIMNPATRAGDDECVMLLKAVYDAIVNLDAKVSAHEDEEPPIFEPAVSVRRSLSSPDRIISMIDGTSHSYLSKHLKYHGLTPEMYRERYGLKPEYPMVAASYSAMRRMMAIENQLATKAHAARAAKKSRPAPRSKATLKQRTR